MLNSLKLQAKRLKRLALTVYFAARDPRMPLGTRLLALAVAAYAFSPIDLIPDIIPILGYLDDLLLVPLGIALVIKLTPPEIMDSARQQAEHATERPVSMVAGIIIVVLWLLTFLLVGSWLVQLWG